MENMENRFDVTGIPIWVCLKALYEGALQSKKNTPLNLGIPAHLMHVIGAMQGSPTELEFQNGLLDDGRLPDYFRGMPIKVTTDFFDAEQRYLHSFQAKENPEKIKYCSIGRLDLFDRDNGGSGTAEAILGKLVDTFNNPSRSS